MILVKTKNFDEAREIANKNFGKCKIAAVAQDSEFNRKILETGKINFLIFYKFFGNNKLKERASGLNQILCKIASKNNVIIGIDFSEISNLKEFELSDYLAKVVQNIKLCRKYKVKIVFANIGKTNKRDLMAFGLSLGMSTDMAKSAVENSFNFY